MGISSEELKRIASVGAKSIDQSETFPYDLMQNIGKVGVGLDIYNKDPATTLYFSVRQQQTGKIIGPFIVPDNTSLSEDFPPFTRIIIDQTTTDFIITIRTELE